MSLIKPLPRRNRVDPWGDLHAVVERGLFTGNRGCLVNGVGGLTRHHQGSRWITCLTKFSDFDHPLDAPRTWTPLFFLDDAVALAAGHRPCGYCRREDYNSYRDAAGATGSEAHPPLANELDRRLSAERLRRGRGLDRAGDRIVWVADVGLLPEGTVVIDEQGRPRLVTDRDLFYFSFEGWKSPRPKPRGGTMSVLTPPTSVTALRNGYHPKLHLSAAT